MELEISDELALHLERFFSHLDVDLFIDAIENDALTGARSHQQLRYDVNAAIHAMPSTPDPVFRSRYLYIDFHDFWKQHSGRGHVAGDKALASSDAITRSSSWSLVIGPSSPPNCRPAVSRASRRWTSKSPVWSTAQIGGFYSRSNGQ